MIVGIYSPDADPVVAPLSQAAQLTGLTEYKITQAIKTGKLRDRPGVIITVLPADTPYRIPESYPKL